MHSHSDNSNQSAYTAFSIFPKIITFTCYQFINGTHNSKRLGGEIDTTNEITKIKSFPQSNAFLAKFCSVVKQNYSCQKYGILTP